MGTRSALGRVIGAGVLVAALSAAAPAGAAASIDIPSAAHLTIVGASPGFGNDVSGAGDVNGDGIPDAIVSDTNAGSVPESDPDVAAYVVFGRRTPTTVNVANLGSAGFRIAGPVDQVSAAGDVNGDGKGDVLVTTRFADFNGRAEAGAAYVVFGKSTGGTVTLSALGSGGFEIGGPRAVDANRVLIPFVSADGAGDVNGDGKADVVVGFAQANCVGSVPSCQDYAGSAYVVYGKSASGAVDTAALGSAGYSITGGLAGSSVAGLGDVNGDGIPDVAVSRRFQNAGWVVFGRRPGANVDLANLGSGGFEITDSTKTDVGGGLLLPLQSVAWSLDGPGDVNGDGRRDVLVGEGSAGTTIRFDERAAVIFGGPSTAPLDVASLGSRGFQVNGGNFLGDPAAAAGDVNGDGRADVILNGAGANGGADLGAVVVFGRSSTGPVDVNALDGDGVSLTGAFHDSGDLRSVGTAGDMTGDGAADVVIGAPWPGNLGRAYVVSLLPSVSQRLAELRFQIASFGLPTSLRDRFFRRLDRIRFAYVGGNQPSACRRIQRLSAFAQRLNGTKLTAAQTFTIVAGAGRVGRAAGC